MAFSGKSDLGKFETKRGICQGDSYKIYMYKRRRKTSDIHQGLFLVSNKRFRSACSWK